jgi:hypothetical protein
VTRTLNCRAGANANPADKFNNTPNRSAIRPHRSM